MSVSPLELKQLAENLTISITPLFDWETCLPKFQTIFKAAVDSKSDSLMLSGSNITRDDLPCILAFLSAHPTITTLDVSHNFGLLSQGVLALIQGNTSLSTLNVAGSMGGRDIDTHTRALRALAHHTTLTSLNISGNLINDEGVVILAGSTTLKILNLSNNIIMNKGAIALANNTSFESLDVTANGIGVQGATALTQIAQNRIKILQDQQLALLIGMHPRVGAGSSVFDFSNNSAYERKTLLEIFAFFEPATCQLIPTFDEIMESAAIADGLYYVIREAIKMKYAPGAQTQNEVLSIILAIFSITEDQYNDINHGLAPFFVDSVVSLNRGESDDFEAHAAGFIRQLDRALNAQKAEVEQRLARQRAEAEAARVAALARQVASHVYAPVEAPGERGVTISAVCRREP